ncbi:MAG: tRNA pseudouridine(38-40) synthase TruA [Rhodospirillales bacterium RIFCSPLOWO2_12_FULL_67_15]|nr:MAG: tRNA pseudouridine(38-40) synthase TruA [Rhodospirillales bacterium RIFCSPLOWO2_12_FULL_67_15]
MPRYRLLLEYDGGPYVGWQRQENGLSVQEVLEGAIFALAGERVETIAAGRTDAGVHAEGQVVHFDLAREFPPETVRDALNFHMKPHPVAVREAALAPTDFHARFSAKSRSYVYRIANRRARLALDFGRKWWVPAPLDADAMAEAAKVLVGRHDFTTFRAALCQAQSPVKTLDVLTAERAGEDIVISARARSFLHHQVRNMVGTLRLVGEGKWTAADVRSALEARDRAKGGPTAPACGLYLVEVGY